LIYLFFLDTIFEKYQSKINDAETNPNDPTNTNNGTSTNVTITNATGNTNVPKV